jgi:hypothetical protein
MNFGQTFEFIRNLEGCCYLNIIKMNYEMEEKGNRP